MPQKAKKITDVDEFLKIARERKKDVEEYESLTRKLQEIDLGFIYREQWLPGDKTKRNGERRPAITIRRSKQFLDRIKNEQRQNKPSIKVSPVDDGAQEVFAKRRQGLIRHIQYDSKANLAFQRAYDFAVDMGRGWFKVSTDYVHGGTFDQKLMIESIKDQFSIYMDKNHLESDYSDCKYGFEMEKMLRTDFEEKYPEADPCSWSQGSTSNEWIEEKHVLIAKYYVKEQKDRILWRVDMDGVEENVFKDTIEDPENYKHTVIEERKVPDDYVHLYTISPKEILESEETVFKTIPLVPIIGEETDIDGVYDLKGVARDIIDPCRQYNFYHSQETEMMSNAPKTPYIGAVGQFEGVENQWEDNDSYNAFKEYKPVSIQGTLAPPPQRADFVNFPAGLAQAKTEIVEDIKAITGYYNTSSGDTSNEIAGVAIRQRIQQGNTATFHFVDNANIAITSAGRILNEGIPAIYTVGRTVTIMGEDDENEQFTVGEEKAGGEVEGFGTGEFSVVISIGASYNTKREENIANLLELSAANATIAESSPDLLVKEMDFPNKDAIAERSKRMIETKYPGLTAPIVDKEDSELQIMADQLNQTQQKLQEVSQQAEEMGQKLQSMDEDKQRTEAMKVQKDLKDLEIKQGELVLKSKELQADIRKADLTAKTDIHKAKLSSRTSIEVKKMEIASQKDTQKPDQK